jgi:predicted ester cyclase
MSIEENKALDRRSYEEFNKHNWAGVEEDLAPDYVVHFPGADMDVAGMKQLTRGIWTAFPDAYVVVEDVIAEGDKVVSRCTMRGTHQGDFMGIAPTGKQISYTWIAIDRIKDGKFVEGWANSDDLGLMQQLGAIPQMAQTGA